MGVYHRRNEILEILDLLHKVQLLLDRKHMFTGQPVFPRRRNRRPSLKDECRTRKRIDDARILTCDWVVSVSAIGVDWSCRVLRWEYLLLNLLDSNQVTLSKSCRVDGGFKRWRADGDVSYELGDTHRINGASYRQTDCPEE